MLPLWGETPPQSDTFAISGLACDFGYYGLLFSFSSTAELRGQLLCDPPATAQSLSNLTDCQGPQEATDVNNRSS